MAQQLRNAVVGRGPAVRTGQMQPRQVGNNPYTQPHPNPWTDRPIGSNPLAPTLRPPLPVSPRPEAADRTRRPLASSPMAPSYRMPRQRHEELTGEEEFDEALRKAQRNSRKGKYKQRQPEPGTLSAEILSRWPDLPHDTASSWAQRWVRRWIELEEIRAWWDSGFDYSGLEDVLRLKDRGMTPETMKVELNGRTVASLLRAGHAEVDIALMLRKLDVKPQRG